MKDKQTHFIVIDTNVLISAGLLPNSKTAHSVTLAFDHFVLAQNQLTWTELQEKSILSKFNKYFGVDGRLRLMARLTQNIEFIDAQAIVTDCRDPKDNKFLALAIDADAKTIITGDKDLLVMNPYQGRTICTPAEFLSRHGGLATKQTPTENQAEPDASMRAPMGSKSRAK